MLDDAGADGSDLQIEVGVDAMHRGCSAHSNHLLSK